MKKIARYWKITLLSLLAFALHKSAIAQCDITPSAYKACKGSSIAFTIASPPSTYSSIKWEFGDGDSSSQKTSYITHIYDTFGTFVVKVTTFDAGGTIKCGPKTITMTIFDRPKGDFDLPNPNIMCYEGNYFCFKDKSKPGKNNAPISYRYWDFGDGDSSTAKDPCHGYKASGVYTIIQQIKDTNGCIDTLFKVSSIKVLPDLDPKMKTDYKISCPTTPVKMTNLTDSTGKCVASWWWDFGDGSGDSSMSSWNAEITHIYTKDGSFNPTFYVKSCYGCVDSFVAPSGARNIFYWFDIKKSASGPVCWEGNSICFEQRPRPNAYYWLWTFDDPPSQQLNNNDEDWKPCHAYTAPGIYHITLKIWEPNCIRDTTFCSYIPLKGPQAMIKLPPPAKNSKCEAGKKMSYKDFDACFLNNCNPKAANGVTYATRSNVAKYPVKTDSFYCNAPVVQIDSVLKPGCTDTVVTKINYRLGNAQGAVTSFDSVVYYPQQWFPGDPYPAQPIFYPQVGGCNYKNIHDTDQYISNCQGPNLVFFPNNSVKYRMRYDIDNNANKFTIPPGKDMSMDKCKNPSYPWASDSMQHFWDFADSYGDPCTSTTQKPNVKCMYSTEIAPLHLYSKTGCYSVRLIVTDTVTKCTSTSNVTIVMEPPDAGWDTKVFKKLDWATQLQVPPAMGRRGVILNGIPCVGQPYPQRPDFQGTLPSCGRQKWWMVFDSAAQCATPCKDSVWADTNVDGTPDKLIRAIIPQCGWIDDETFAMMGNKWIYSKGGCKTIGLIIKTGDCFDTFWYNQYKYIADLNAAFDILDPASYDPTLNIYANTLDYANRQHMRLCAPHQAILTVADTAQVGITRFDFIVGKFFGAPWTHNSAPLIDSCKIIEDTSYMLCHKDSFTVDPFSGDTTFTACFYFPNPSLNCGIDNIGNLGMSDFASMGYVVKRTYYLLDLTDTVSMIDPDGRSLWEPGKYTVTTTIRNMYGCSNAAQAEIHVGHYTDYVADDQIICYEGGGDTVMIKATVLYFRVKQLPWEPEVNPIEFWLDPLSPRGGNPPAAPSVPESMTWDLNGDGTYGDEALLPTGRPDSVRFVYTLPGDYTVRLKTIDSNSCEQILDYMKIKVIGVVAEFDTANSPQACAPQTVKFLDKSYGLNCYQYTYNLLGQKIDSVLVDSTVWWSWDFGDNLGPTRSSSVLENPIHTYVNNGKYPVNLIVKNSNGCVDTVLKPDYIYIQGPQPSFRPLDTIGCQPFTVFIKDSSASISNWEFAKGDGTVASFKTRPTDSIFAITYNNPGVFYIHLSGSDSVLNPALGKYFTCTSVYADTTDMDEPHYRIEVLPILKAKFDGDTLICSGTTAEFEDLTDTTYTTLAWGFGDDTNIVVYPRGNISHTYNLPGGVYDQTYTITMNPQGYICPDVTQFRTIRVVDTKADLDTYNVVKPEYWFENLAKGANTYKWTIKGKDPNNLNYYAEYEDTSKIIYHNFLNDTGSFEVCVIAWIERNGLIGCTDTSCLIVVNDFEVKLEIPNVFSPGVSKDANDKFIIKHQGVEKWELTILNRWGEKVYKSEDPNDFWDGTKMNNGKTECPAGTYYYVLNYQLRGAKEASKSGTVTLFR